MSFNKSKNQNKIYFRKKNHRFNMKRLKNKTVYNNKEKDKEKIMAKITNDTLINYNMNNKSFQMRLKILRYQITLF